MERISIFSNSDGDYFMTNLWWIILIGVAGLIGLYFLFSFVFRKKKAAKKAAKIDSNKYLSALGGAENVLSHELVGSRIVVSLKDYNKINRPLLEEAGVTGFIEKSDKLTLVIKTNAKAVYDAIFSA
jgi:phosphotransferase system IIB component